MIEVKLVQDQDSHWYLIPAVELERFNEINSDDERWEEMEAEFSQFMTGGDYSHLKLFAENETVYRR